LGLDQVIEEALHVDREGSAILEHLLQLQDNSMVGFDGAGLKEVISITSWYLWWIRRKRTHDESVPTNYKCKMLILAMAANAARVIGRSSPNSDAKWCKPEPRQVKVNVDASFYTDLHAGSIGAIARDYQGSFIAENTVYLPHVASSAMAEAIAMSE
jgi:hypothetical protein